MAEDIYRTTTALRRELRVRYPAAGGRITIRTELDWGRDIEPDQVTDGGTTFVFTLEARKPYLYFKSCLHGDGQQRWSTGTNALVLLTHSATREVYPCFSEHAQGTLSDLIELPSSQLGRPHVFRAYLPPGYEENTLRSYPVLYMHDGANLFFPEEAFLGREWQVDESLALLDDANALDHVIVVGLHSGDRMQEYTKPGYDAYANAIVQEVRPHINGRFRVLQKARETGVMGSSLGGVVSFYMAWQHPDVFGCVGCLSSTFSFQDDLIERVLAEPRRDLRIYLDSGWPGDNFEVTLAMALALHSCEYEYGRDFLHFTFPLAAHEEPAWAERLHLPLQLFWGKVATAARGRFV